MKKVLVCYYYSHNNIIMHSSFFVIILFIVKCYMTLCVTVPIKAMNDHNTNQMVKYSFRW